MVRGDVDGSGALSVTDAVKIFRFLFLSAPEVARCEDAADVNDDGNLNITDGIYLLQFLFLQGAPPPYPFPFCGMDSVPEDSLSCEEFPSCQQSLCEFYGQLMACDTVIFVIDRSGGMQDSGELPIAKREIVHVIEELPETSEFAVVFFDMGIVKFPSGESPALATQDMKESAVAFISGVPGGAGSCLKEGLLEGLRFALNSTSRQKVLIYVGDGGGTCRGQNEVVYLSQTIRLATEENGGRVQIDCIGVLMSGRMVQEQFLRELAAANGGTYRRVN
jgi:hypothetical protein